MTANDTYMMNDPSVSVLSILRGTPESSTPALILNTWRVDAMKIKSTSIAKYLPGHILCHNIPDEFQHRVMSSDCVPSSKPEYELGWITAAQIKFAILIQKTLWQEHFWAGVPHRIARHSPRKPSDIRLISPLFV